MSPQEATLIAAIVAAALSFASIIMNIFSARSAAEKEALRKILYDDVSEIGGEMYRIIATSKKMLNAKSDASFQNFRIMAVSSQSRLNELRAKVRYSLWGLDDGIQALRSTPFYVVQYKNKRTSREAKKIIELSTSLRRSIDSAIMRVLVTGRPPTWLRRKMITYRAWRLRSHFERNAPSGYRRQ